MYRRPRSPVDQDKPPVPYTLGLKLTIHRHTPPPPFGKPYSRGRAPTPRETLAPLTQLDYCLSAAPLGGTTQWKEVLSLTITKELVVRDGHRAQLVMVNNDFVAKIYDPLYYHFRYEEAPVKDDVVWDAERDYSREAAAYEEIAGQFGGTIVPKYYGSWTCNMPVKTAKGVVQRAVRLILMEFIHGVTMLELDPRQLPDMHRTNIMVKAIEADHTLWQRGVDQGDFSPRNVICSGNDLGSADLRVVLIDFNTARVMRLIGFPPKRSKLPVSPIDMFGTGLPQDFHQGWVPFPPTEWLWKIWGTSPLYQPATRKKTPSPEPDTTPSPESEWLD